ncbi:mycofactocin biosynthesis glycosyltransferase MftF [Saccharopolyspora elongata]|uniref:Mycofactocin system glycosyltransferase n=1 Tax=Saccharopolyspora elongata TaxID=2530387 RepID=A0A4R4Y4J5_9PSEU|nr:mycofactocin biosynthesis glycosyltransferase MftF [Saccharopolyspora elongata]TDD39175.1 mycofactocin system glycosyltransferase [Saccharopolyspora elongata]
MSTALPTGFAVELDKATRISRDGTLVFGGSPARLLRLNRRAADLLGGGAFTVRDTTSARLARVLLDAGVVHPRPARTQPRSVAIVIPVRDRVDMLARVLRAVRTDPATADVPVVVVDDGSRDGEAVRAVASEHDAEVVRHETSRGPAAARNAGLRATAQEFVTFCDSDTVPLSGWLPPLLAQFDDPCVGLVAPRIVALPEERETRIGAFERTCSPLDLGAAEAPVIPMSKVAYVPSAAIVLRRSAAPGGFAEELRVAEDVDLCMRLHRAGWRLRYVPAAQVAHDHRTGLVRWVARRAFYGSGAALLARRHPGQVPPMHVTGWSLLAVGLLLTRRPAAVAAALGLSTVAGVRLARRMPDADTPVRAAGLLTLAGLFSTAVQLLRAGVRHHWPLALALAISSRRARRLLILGSTVDALVERSRRGSRVDPVTFVALRRLDDLAYGAGVWWGAVRQRTPAPLVPKIAGFRCGRFRHRFRERSECGLAHCGP